MSNQSQPRISLAKNILVIVIGLFFALLVVEVSLWFFNWGQQQNRSKTSSVDHSQTYTILALGESTTAPAYDSSGRDYSWPALLEESLKQSSLGEQINFKVINQGWSGLDSSGILEALEENLTAHEPDLVISMMGINDYGRIEYEAAAGIESESFLARFKTYHLIKLIRKNLQDKWLKETANQSQTEQCNSIEACFNQAELALESGEISLAREAWKNILKYDPQNRVALLQLTNRHLDWEETTKAWPYLQTLSENYVDDPQVNIALGRYYLIKEDFTQATNHYRRALTADPQLTQAYMGLLYCSQSAPDPLKAFTQIISLIEENQLKDIELYRAMNGMAQRVGYEKDLFTFIEEPAELNEEPYLLVVIARYYFERGQYDQAEQYYQLSTAHEELGSVAALELAELYRQTGRDLPKELNLSMVLDPEEDKYVVNYLKLYQSLQARNIPLIAVQYPRRSIEPLELIFGNKKNVWLVDNQLSFEQQVANQGYDSVFIDNFAGNFGHCSVEGNTLIVQNILKTLNENWSEIISLKEL